MCVSQHCCLCVAAGLMTWRAICRGAIAGHDRQWLPVWHRVAGEKNVVVSADAAGAIAVLDMQEDVEQYCASLDTRGIRECALNAALQATLPSLARRNAAAKAAARGVRCCIYDRLCPMPARLNWWPHAWLDIELSASIHSLNIMVVSTTLRVPLTTSDFRSFECVGNASLLWLGLSAALLQPVNAASDVLVMTTLAPWRISCSLASLCSQTRITLAVQRQLLCSCVRRP